MSDILNNLNDKQKEAVINTEGRVRIVAGAGSGKTRVLAHRFAFLVNEIGVEPSNILCMTFTNKAAQEMKNRISKMVHRSDVNDLVCTIHGFCVKVLRRDIYRMGYPKNFNIIDDEDSKAIAKQVIEEMHIERSDSTIKQILDNVSKYKALDNYIERLILPSASNNFDDISPVIRYIQLQMKSYAIDFNDIIYFAIYLLNKYDDVRDYWQDKLNYVMVDEVQDCNLTDWNLINIISKKYNNLFIVGDPDQAIYEWRGARPDAFINFKSDSDIILNENYRSTPNILDVANSVIAKNTKRVPKDLFTQKSSSIKVLHLHAKSEKEESDWIAKKIKSLVKKGADYGDIAILYRASYLSRSVEQALLRQKIKYTVWGGIRFFERREIKDSLAYLRLIEFNDDISFRRIINTPSRKFGKVSLQHLQEFSEKDNIPLYDALKKYKDRFGKEAIDNFIELIDSCRVLKDTVSISDLLDNVLKLSGLEEMYRLEGDEERLENIAELMGSIKDYERLNENEEDQSLSIYLQDIALYTNADYKQDGSTVKLMTVHQAKGLEFPYVFVIGLSEGIFPNHKAIRERKKDAEEEERRLMYVAITRAEKALYLTESEGYNHASHTPKYPSRFFNEITKKLIKIEGEIDSVLIEGTKHLVDQLNEEINNENNTNFKIGDEVYHKYFGTGKIIEINNGTYKVAFGEDDKNIRYLNPRVLTIIKD